MPTTREHMTPLELALSIPPVTPNCNGVGSCSTKAVSRTCIAST